MTFSIAARDPESGMFGVAVSSSSPAVAARCAHVRAGVGAVCSQNITDPRLGTVLLDRLASGELSEQAMAEVVAAEPLIHFRQLSAIGLRGAPATFAGGGVLGLHASALGADCVCCGNLLASPRVPQAMVDAFTRAGDIPFPARLIGAMQAALDAGGEEGPVHSVGLLVVREVPWPIVDLRVDWSDDPIGDLAALWELWEPQLEAYVTRAVNPGVAPSYGVPGDE